MCVLFGSEIDGLSAELLDRCDTHVRIPMLGLKHSLNVSTAGGVVLYELLRKFRDRAVRDSCDKKFGRLEILKTLKTNVAGSFV